MFAAAAGIPFAGWSGQWRDEERNGRQLLVWTGLRRALQQGDLGAWRAGLQDFETGYVQPLWQALRAGKISQLQVDVPGGDRARRLLLNRANAWAFWRRPAAGSLFNGVEYRYTKQGMIMSFWNAAINYFWREESFPVLVMALGIAFLLLHFRKEDRNSIINTLIFFFVCLGGQFISSLIHALDFTKAAAILHEAFTIGSGIEVIRLWGSLLFRMVLPYARLTPPRIAEDIFVIIGYVALGLRLRYAGLDLTSILATSAMITAVVAFAMQDTLGNILGGLALQLDNSVEIGDWIKVDDISGRVVDIRWRSTLVETRNWETVVFPNSQLMKNKFMVLGRRNDQPVQWRRWVWFNVSLNTTPTRVVSAVENAILQAEINNVSKNPQPSCVLMEMDKGCARYALRYWLTDLAADDTTDAAVRWHIFTALERVGIKLAVEEHNAHYIKENEKHEEAVH